MDFRTLLLMPRFESRIARLWKNALPDACRLTADPAGPGHLEVEMLYPRPARGETPVHMARWTLIHDTGNGRILRLTFADARPDPKLPYDELDEALRAINLAHATVRYGSEPYRFGLATASKLLLEWLTLDEIVLRAALTPPFPDAPS